MQKLQRGEALVDLLCQHQRRAAREEARTRRALAARCRIDLDDLFQRAVVTRRVALALVDLGDLEVRLDRRFDRLRELLDVALVHRERAIRAGRLFVQLAGEQQCFGAHLAIVRLSRDALVLIGGLRQLAGLAIDHRDLLGGLALQLVLGIRRTERVEHCGRGSPVLQ